MTVATPKPDAPAFNPFDPAFTESPYQLYAILRDEDPVQYSELLCGWVVTRHADVAALLRDPTISSSVHNATPTAVTRIELERLAEQPRAARTVVMQDDPDHARTRKLMAKPFRVSAIEQLRMRVHERMHAALDELAARLGGTSGRTGGAVDFDLVEDFAYPLPVEIFSQMLGVPEEDNPKFRYWTQCVARSVDPVLPDDERDESIAALDEMYEYLAAQAALKRADPADDLMSHLVHAEIDGERLDDLDLMSQLVTLYMAGHEPTSVLIGNGTLALTRHPDQLERLRGDRGLLLNAISELLRFDGPNQFTRRITTQPTTLSGVELPAGAVVYAGLASANRDPRFWGDDSEVVRVDRPEASKHLQFGAGVHACLGSHLARLQAEVAFTAILDRLEGLEVTGEPVVATRMFLRGLTSLPVRAAIRAR
ncbi:MAG: cytochrome P450 [Microthrixaceae bacterium]